MTKFPKWSKIRIQSSQNEVNKNTNCDYDINNIDSSLFKEDIYFELARSIGEFKNVILRACEESAPSVIAKYLLGLAQIFNKFYANVKINVSDEKVKNTNFMIAHATRIVINEGLRLLGIEFVEQL